MSKKQKMASVILSLAAMVAPVASQGCWVVFYDEEEPKNFHEFAKSMKEQKKCK